MPAEIRIEGVRRSMPTTAALLESIYVNGLGEFAYRNGLNLHGRIRFPHAAEATRRPRRRSACREHALVAIGGGKDSLCQHRGAARARRRADRDAGSAARS